MRPKHRHPASPPRRPPRQHRALVDVALVGDLAAVDGGGFGQQQRPRGVARRMAALRLQSCKALRDRAADLVVTDHVVHIGAVGQTGMGAARRDVREHQEANLVAAMAGDHDILRQRRQRGDAGDAQRADADPGAGIELEIFGDAAVEEQSEFGPRRIGKGHGIADQIEAFGIERLRGQFRRLPVARRDVRAAHAHFQLVARRHQLQFGARDRHADIAGALGLEMAIGRERRRLGRAPGRHHRQRAADGRDRQLFQRVPEILRQRGAGIEGELHLAEEFPAQRVVAAQRRDQHVEAARHVEIDRRHHAAQIGQRRREQSRRRLAAVDIERAAVAQHQVEIVVGAEGVAPRQPVEDDELVADVVEKGPGLRLRLLARGQHALGVDHGLRRAGRARREQEFCDRVRRDRGERFFDVGRFRRGGNGAERNRIDRPALPLTIVAACSGSIAASAAANGFVAET